MDKTQLIDYTCLVAIISSSTHYEWVYDSLPEGRAPETLYFFSGPDVAIGPRHISPGYWSLDEDGNETSVYGSDWSPKGESGWQGNIKLPNGMVIHSER
jgi:hypothetical protein